MQQIKQRTSQQLRVVPALIMANHILQLTSEEFDHMIIQMQELNPLLEVQERAVCSLCGKPYTAIHCPSCSVSTKSEAGEHEMKEWRESYDYAVSPDYSNEGYDPLVTVPMPSTLKDSLLQQLRLMLHTDDQDLAEYLVGSLTPQGYLDLDINEVVQSLGISQEHIEHAITTLQTLDPPGIGARTVQECLLLQLTRLDILSEEKSLTQTLIERYMKEMSTHDFLSIAESIDQTVDRIVSAYKIIQTCMYPYPAYLSDLPMSTGEETPRIIQPDCIIQKKDGTCAYTVQLLEQSRYTFSVHQDTFLLQKEQGSEPWQEASREASQFIEHIQRRWSVLHKVMVAIIDHQQAFLDNGPRDMQALTQTALAQELALDESVLSRAITKKYTLLPNGRIFPITGFFDRSMSIRESIIALIAKEDEQTPLSDQEIVEKLAVSQVYISRRTVMKYREQAGIASSYHRGASNIHY
jgi:RNA polymerase sigma-54 factor